jgi:circadian clock protein KaiC
MAANESISDNLASTGVTGLDLVIRGGLPVNRTYLVEGDPGSGKTTLGLQFLLDGAARGEKALYVTLSETRAELEGVARSHGWDLANISIQELASSDGGIGPDDQYTFFHPSEVELAETTKAMLDEVSRIHPTRLVIDSLSEMRLLAREPLRYRRQILALKQFFATGSCTVMLLDDRTSGKRDLQLHSLAHGVIVLQQMAPEYGGERRRLRVSKLRGVAFDGGYHDFVIERGGLRVFPRLVAAESRTRDKHGSASTGVAAIDRLFGGGLERGSSTLIVGPAGSGKSALATQIVAAAAARGERVAFYMFDEGPETFVRRAQGLNADVERYFADGRIVLTQVDPAELSPGEFAHGLRRSIESDKTQLVVIDSLNGYLNATPSEKYLTLHLHEILTYLGQCGATTLLLMTQHGIVGQDMSMPIDASYLADSVVSLRYFEAHGEVRQSISVIKKRTGRHERTIRELRLDNGVTVGNVVRDFEGVLSGFPRFVGDVAALSAARHESAAGD